MISKARGLELCNVLLRHTCTSQHVASHAILASNTSSISITAIANGLQHPERVVGMHFFNPVPLMKLVEVVSGAETQQSYADAVFEIYSYRMCLVFRMPEKRHQYARDD
jgi:3-hydroxybutyryl-CoA dehydrogenase